MGVALLICQSDCCGLWETELQETELQEIELREIELREIGDQTCYLIQAKE